jgi:hypothetical protein
MIVSASASVIGQPFVFFILMTVLFQASCDLFFDFGLSIVWHKLHLASNSAFASVPSAILGDIKKTPPQNNIIDTV